MHVRRSLLAAVAAAALMTACAGDAVTPLDEATAAPPQDTTEDTTEDATDEAPTVETPEGDAAQDDAAAGGTQPATVALRFDGQRVPIASACNGVDGAVLATTEGEVTITLVREDGIAMRYEGEGMSAETGEVNVEEVGASTIHRATLASDEVPSVEVELELGDTSVMQDC